MAENAEPAEAFLEQHYAQCVRYIEALKSSNLSFDKMREITRDQRISEGRFAVAMQGRKNLRYPKLCAERRDRSASKDIPQGHVKIATAGEASAKRRSRQSGKARIAKNSEDPSFF